VHDPCHLPVSGFRPPGAEDSAQPRCM